MAQENLEINLFLNQLKLNSPISDSTLQKFQYSAEDVAAEIGEPNGTVRAAEIRKSAHKLGLASPIRREYLDKLEHAYRSSYDSLEGFYTPFLTRLQTEIGSLETELTQLEASLPVGEEKITKSYQPRIQRLEAKVKQLEHRLDQAKAKFAPLVDAEESGINTAYWRGVLEKNDTYKRITAQKRGVTPDQIHTERDDDSLSQKMRKKLAYIDGLYKRWTSKEAPIKKGLSQYSSELTQVQTSMRNDLEKLRTGVRTRKDEIIKQVQYDHAEKTRLEKEYGNRLFDVSFLTLKGENEIRKRTEELYERQEATKVYRELIAQRQPAKK